MISYSRNGNWIVALFLACSLSFIAAQEDRPGAGAAYEFHSLYETGLKLYGRGEYEMALDFFLRAAPLDATGYIAYESIGDTYVALGKNTDAVQSYEFCVRTLEANPDSGSTSVRTRILEKVLGLIRSEPALLSQLKSKITAGYLEKAIARQEDKRKEEEARMKKADEATRKKLINEQLVRQGKVDDETMKQTETSDRFNVSGVLSLLAKGDAYFRRSRFEEAMAIYGQLIEMFPEYIEFWERRGDALRLMDKKDEAAEAYATAIALAKSTRNRLESKMALVKE